MMRIESPRNFGQGWRVYCDAVEIKDVVMADDDAGIVERQKRDASGYLSIDYSSGTRVVETETITGSVILARSCGKGSVVRR